MKNKIIAIVFTVILLSVFGCQKKNPLPEQPYRVTYQHYENASGEKAVTIYYYDEAGINQTAKWMLLDSSRVSMNYHTFDKEGRLIVKYREYREGLVTTEYYTYNDAGTLTEERIEGSDGRTGTAQHLTDEKGRVIVTECDKYKGWFSGTIRYAYNDRGVKEKAVIYRGENIIGQIHYSYNDAGLLAAERWDFDEGWWQEFRYDYMPVPDLNPPTTFESPYLKSTNAYRLDTEVFDYNEDQRGTSTYLYDQSGKLREKRFGSLENPITTTNYYYDDQDVLQSSKVSYNSLNTTPTEYTYEFDGNRRLTHRSYNRKDRQGSEIYTYDEKGRLKEAILDNMNGRISGKLTYLYDQNGLLLGANIDGDGGYKGKLFLTFDDNGLLQKAQWVFSYGKFQSFEYKWEPAKVQ